MSRFILFLFTIGSLVFPLTAFSEDFSKSASALEQIKGQYGAYSLWIDPTKWKLSKEYSKECEQDLVFCYGDNELFANFHAQAGTDRSKTLESLRGCFLDQISKYVPHLKVQKEEERVVNGLKVHYLQVLLEMCGPQLITDAYLYVGDSFTVSVSVISSEDLRPSYEKQIFDFLNGFSN